MLTREDLAGQARRYADEFHLNVLLSTTVSSATYEDGRWTIKIDTPAGKHTVVARQLVQATGIGSQKAYVPAIPDEGYKGVNIHSTQYQNPATLKSKGVSSVVVVGSANTGFDILEDCHNGGMQATMLVRSPTYIVPLEYITNPLSLGVYDSGVAAADRLILSLPMAIDAALSTGLFAGLASSEPDRYKALAAAGFPVLDSAHEDCSLMHNLVERAGGHYVDVGTTQLISDGKVGVKANVEAVALTETGLRFSDGSSLDADAVVWCTGFADKDARGVAADVIGDLADQLEPTWGLDEEGEICGLWKRTGVERFWVMGGYTQLHRWHSRTLALQIKADLAGVLPEAYRK